MTIYQRLEPLQTFWFDRESMYMMGFGSFWGQTGWPCSKHESQRQKVLRSSWNWNLVKPNLSLLWHSSLPNYVMATLRMSRRSGQIGLKRCVHLTDRIANFVTWMVANCCINWHLTVAKCAKCVCQVAYPSVSVATKELSESALLAVSIGEKGILLLSQWHCIRILHFHRGPVIQYNVGQTWGLLTAPLFEFANACSWFIWVHST